MPTWIEKLICSTLCGVAIGLGGCTESSGRNGADAGDDGIDDASDDVDDAEEASVDPAEEEVVFLYGPPLA
jgi:hypothetical protein